MIDNSEKFVYRRDGEEAEVVVYAPDGEAAERGFGRAVRAASMPGVEGTVHAAAAESGYGHAVVAGGSVSPEMVSAPERGVLLSCEVEAKDFARRLGVAEHQVNREVSRRIGESVYGLPRPDRRSIRRACEAGAEELADAGVIEEEDLAFLGPLAADPEAAGRRALAAGEREWGRLFADVTPYSPSEVFDPDALEDSGFEAEGLLLFLSVGAGELGRLVFSLHRERFRSRILTRDFDFVRDPSGGVASLCVGPSESEEAGDFVAASASTANFSDALSALSLFVVRRALGGVLGGIEIRSSWRCGGILQRDGLMLHRDGLAAVEADGVFVCGGNLCSGKGEMESSAPSFYAPEPEGRWPWEEAGLVGRLARLKGFG
ncbi:hypothetical protein [Rubrobacter indicoceani]|uniref:hypothetical protein n=1 Tax=Rubrobacter indicoceani TaxID=2051957 RepID=UPI000E5AE556|nr:hypothetical protein [Rubrobacter indicoceani]